MCLANRADRPQACHASKHGRLTIDGVNYIADAENGHSRSVSVRGRGRLRTWLELRGALVTDEDDTFAPAVPAQTKQNTLL